MKQQVSITVMAVTAILYPLYRQYSTVFSTTIPILFNCCNFPVVQTVQWYNFCEISLNFYTSTRFRNNVPLKKHILPGKIPVKWQFSSCLGTYSYGESCLLNHSLLKFTEAKAMWIQLLPLIFQSYKQTSIQTRSKISFNGISIQKTIEFQRSSHNTTWENRYINRHFSFVPYAIYLNCSVQCVFYNFVHRCILVHTRKCIPDVS